MSFLNTPHKKKSAILTAIMAALLGLLFFIVGLTYYDPPVIYGMEVNFGTSNQGTGDIKSEKSITSESSKATNEPIVEKVNADINKEIFQETVKEVLTEKNSINLNNEAIQIKTKGRHDPCVGIRAVPVAEAMLAITFLDQLLEHESQIGSVI